MTIYAGRRKRLSKKAKAAMAMALEPPGVGGRRRRRRGKGFISGLLGLPSKIMGLPASLAAKIGLGRRRAGVTYAGRRRRRHR